MIGKVELIKCLAKVAAKLWELTLERRLPRSTNEASRHRVPVPGSHDPVQQQTRCVRVRFSQTNSQRGIRTNEWTNKIKTQV